MTFSTFVGNVGGQAGLWLGASVVTFVKILLTLSHLAYHKVQLRMRNN
jgi:hypothetical protein